MLRKFFSSALLVAGTSSSRTACSCACASAATTSTATTVLSAYPAPAAARAPPRRRRMAKRPIVVSGPSGGGKSTLLKRLFEDYPNCFAFTVSHTTRAPREGEEHGRDYYFVSRAEMERAIRDGEFLEYAEFGGNLYGTSKKAVEEVEKTGRICILDIEIQGVRNVKKTDLNPRYIFVKPPSLKAIEDRLRRRGSETEESLRRRLERAERDMKEVEGEPGLFDHVVLNDDLLLAYAHFCKSIESDLELLKNVAKKS